MMHHTERNDIAYWLPKLEAAGLPSPRTTLVKMSGVALDELCMAIDQDGYYPALESFLSELEAAASQFTFPLFMRTGHFSGKHDWSKACFVPALSEIRSHFGFLVDESGLNDMPIDTWALREYLPVQPISTCPKWSGMPVCREFRFFVNAGEIVCWHPYWLREALIRGGCILSDDEYENLCTSPDMQVVTGLAKQAAHIMNGDGAWSIDLLETAKGWFITDMAEAGKSFHFKDCPNEKMFPYFGQVKS